MLPHCWLADRKGNIPVQSLALAPTFQTVPVWKTFWEFWLNVYEW